jgi:SAM-dependent methyltransferase
LKQEEINTQNKKFWSEPCGTISAHKLGITSKKREEFLKYDEFFFGYYPYLKSYINPQKNDEILEIGLGYGSVSQWLMEESTKATFLDIAPGAIEQVRKRAELIGYSRGRFVNESILEVQSVAVNSFDKIVAIGCLHHTGDFHKSIESCYNLLKNGGILVFMVYNAFSYRQFLQHPLNSLYCYFKNEFLSDEGMAFYGAESENAVYDQSSGGESAPCTQFLSKNAISNACAKFKSVDISIENIGGMANRIFGSREKSIKSFIAKKLGTDLYVVCVK